ncbi:MAG: hypothetical protein AB7S38_25435 [Vulcanimicrobiota bacterium]
MILTQTTAPKVSPACRLTSLLELTGQGEQRVALDLPVVGLKAELAGCLQVGRLADAAAARCRFDFAVQQGRAAVLVERPRGGGLAIRWSGPARVTLETSFPGSDDGWNDLLEWEHRFAKGQNDSLEWAITASVSSQMLGRFTAWLAEEPAPLDWQEDGPALAARVVAAVEETFRMDHERKATLAQKVAEDLLLERGFDRGSVDEILAQASQRAGRARQQRAGLMPRAGLVTPVEEEPAVQPSPAQALTRLVDGLLLASPESQREMVVESVVWLDRICDQASLTAAAAGLHYQGTQLLVNGLKGLKSWKTRLEAFLARLV